MPFLPDQREYRAMTVEAVKRTAETDAQAPESMKVRGYCTTYNDPYLLYSYKDGGTRVEFWEQVAPGAFDECDESDVIMQYDHVGHVYARNSNKTLELFDDSHGHGMEAELAGTTIGHQLHEEIAGGYTTKMSMGFTIAERERIEKFEENEDGEKYIIMNTIKKIGKLYDVSAVSLPANPGTEITKLSRCAYMSGEIEHARQELERRRAADRKRKLLALKIKLAQEE